MDEAKREFRKQGLNYTTTSICKIVADYPAPRFYVDYKNALVQYALYKKGQSNIHRDSKRRMYAEIFSRYEHLVNVAVSTGQKVVMSEIMTRVLEQEAPSFYYDGDASWKMYYRVMRNRRKYNI